MQAQDTKYLIHTGSGYTKNTAHYVEKATRKLCKMMSIVSAG